MKAKINGIIKLIILMALVVVFMFSVSGCTQSCNNNNDDQKDEDKVDVDREDDDDEPTLHDGGIADAYSDYFVVGVSSKSSVFINYADLLYNFNSVSPEYDMKWNQTEKAEGVYSYDSLDSFMESAEANDMGVRGHTLIWYQSTPKWVHDKLGNKCKVDENGTPITEIRNGKTVRISDTQPNRELGLQVMRERIESIMTYLGDEQIYCWDVVNEALLPSSDAEEPLTYDKIEKGDIYRNGINDARHFGKDQTDPGSEATVYWRMDWQTIIGDDFAQQAFKMADEVAQENGYEDMDLYYNDYDLVNPVKRDAAVKLVKDLQAAGVRIDGIGEQAHYNLSSYLADKDAWLNNFELMIQKFTELGVDVQLTELEITVNGVQDGKLTEQQEKDQAEMYSEIFRICRKYSNKYEPWKEGAGKVTGITFWGIADTKDSFSRIFNADQTPKKAVEEIMTFADGGDIADTPNTQNVTRIQDSNAPTATNTWQYWTKGEDSAYEIVQNSYENDVLTFRARKIGDDLVFVYKPELENSKTCTITFNVKTNKGCGSIEDSQLLQITGIGENGSESEWITVRGSSANQVTYDLAYGSEQEVKPIKIVVKPTTNFEVEISEFTITEEVIDPTLHNVEKIADHNAPPAKDTWYYWLKETEDKYELAESSYNDGTLTFNATKLGGELRLVYLPNIEAGKTYEITFTVKVNKDCRNEYGSKFVQFINFGASGSGAEWMTLVKDTDNEKTYEISYAATENVKPIKFILHPTTNFEISISDLKFTEKAVEPGPDPVENNIEKIADHNTVPAADTWYYWLKGADSEYAIETSKYSEDKVVLEASNLGNELRLVYKPTLDADKTYTMSFTITINKVCGDLSENKYIQIMNYGANGAGSEWLMLAKDVPTEITYEISYSQGQTVKPVKFILQPVADLKITISNLTFTEKTVEPEPDENNYDLTKIDNEKNPPETDKWFYFCSDDSKCVISEAKYDNGTLTVTFTKLAAQVSTILIKPDISGNFTFSADITCNRSGKFIQLKNGSTFQWMPDFVANEAYAFSHTTSGDNLIRFSINGNPTVSEDVPLTITITNINITPSV